MSESFRLFSDQVLLPGGPPVPAMLEIAKGQIQSIRLEARAAGCDLDLSHQGVLAPGLVDIHAHINEPGRTDWEGFKTATAACTAGGTTTVIDMPLNSIPATTTLRAFETKYQAAQGKCQIDYAFWGGIIPGNLSELEPLARAGVVGFKAFLIASGVDEFPQVTREDLEQAMPIVARLGLPVIVHAELESPIQTQGSPTRYPTYLQSRPPEWEVRAIQMMIELAEQTGCRTHIVHLSAADALEDIAHAKARGIPITVETCPHYLTLCAEDIQEGATLFKCAPPIRELENQNRLWDGLESGAIDFITSDHSPCTPELKLAEIGNFSKAWGGIASLQFTLPLIWTAAQKRRIPLEKIFRWLAQEPARFAGLTHKGRVAVGSDADLILFDPHQPFTLTKELIRYKHPVTPYLGKQLLGPVLMTFLRGRKIFESGKLLSSPQGLLQKPKERLS